MGMWGKVIMNILEIVERLRSSDNKIAYQALKELDAESEKSNSVYQYMDTFIEMINDDNSYIRTRGILLIAANSRWDIAFKIDEIIDKYLLHIMDEKPITARQCIKVLPTVAQYKPDLKEDIISALMNANTLIYADSMQPLVYKDIVSAIKKIKM